MQSTNRSGSSCLTSAQSMQLRSREPPMKRPRAENDETVLPNLMEVQPEPEVIVISDGDSVSQGDSPMQEPEKQRKLSCTWAPRRSQRLYNHACLSQQQSSAPLHSSSMQQKTPKPIASQASDATSSAAETASGHQNSTHHKKKRCREQLMMRVPRALQSTWEWDGQWRMAFDPNDPAEKAAQAQVRKLLEKYLIARQKAVGEEQKRVAAKGGIQRPDLMALQTLMSQGLRMYKNAMPGTLPGIPIGHAFCSRAELSLIGLHCPPVGGIDTTKITKRQLPPTPAPGAPQFPTLSPGDTTDGILVQEEYREGYATSVIMSGMYEDDHDADGGQRFKYTGEGGNDMIGSRKQIADQTLTRGNLRLLGNITMQIPVRVMRKNPDRRSYAKNLYIYDGLYWVTRCWEQRGVSGFKIYRYEFVRLPGQSGVNSSEVHWGNTDGTPLPRALKASSRPGFLMADLSRGLNHYPDGSPNPIPVVNTVDDTPPPRVLLPGEEDTKEGNALLNDPNTQVFVYATNNVIGKGVHRPARASPENCTVEAIKKLNGGALPYHHNHRLCCVKDVIYEVPRHAVNGWSKAELTMAQEVQLGSRYRLELFRTEGKGWGVRSWDSIPEGAFVAEFTGLIMTDDEYAEIEKSSVGTGCHRTAYAFDLKVVSRDDRPYLEDESGDEKPWTGRRRCRRSKKKKVPLRSDSHRNDNNDETSDDNIVDITANNNAANTVEAEHAGLDDSESYTLDAYKYGNVSRFINHSRSGPNLFVQCVLVEHHDRGQCRLCLFASQQIPPLAELCYDYGGSYASEKLKETLQERQPVEARTKALQHHPIHEALGRARAKSNKKTKTKKHN